MTVRARDIALAPYWIATLFTTAKSFRDNPLIGSRLANRLGLHVVRVLLAEALTRFRWWLLRPLLAAGLRRAFHRDGLLVIENFLPADAFEALAREVRGLDGDVWVEAQGDTLTYRKVLEPSDVRSRPALAGLMRERRLERIFRYCSSANCRPIFHVEQIRHGNATASGTVPDPQKTLHADTFHHTVKGWLYLDDADETTGPFVYARGFHRVTPARLRHEYHVSRIGGSREDFYSQRGSVRLSEGPLADAASRAAKPVPVPRNTLVVADTFGFHCRGPAPAGSQRLAVFMSARCNPFRPLPGLNLEALYRLTCRIVAGRLERAERKALAAGREPGWRRVPAAEMGAAAIDAQAEDAALGQHAG